MIISMQGNWTVTVKQKNAAFPQRFVINGAVFGSGAHAGTVGTTANIVGSQWTIAIQNDPGTGYQLSDTQLKFPQKIGGNYVFDINSNDAGGDADFDDLILTCSRPATINDFILYGNVSLYSGTCIFNPCRSFPFVIESSAALIDALKNNKLREIISKLYPERIPIKFPIPPDPEPFRPIVLDLNNEAIQPKTSLVYSRLPSNITKGRAVAEEDTSLSFSNFKLEKSIQSRIPALTSEAALSKADIARIIGGISLNCDTDPASNITLSFEEYDRTAAELAGGAYTGTGNRRILGDTITDAFGNYIFRFTFDMSFPGIEDAGDIAGGEDVNIVSYPDVIVKVIGSSPAILLYESAPYYNISNLKRINLCLPKSAITPTSTCFNGSLIGTLGNVFLGGNQNTAGSYAAAALRRYGFNNFLEANGKITVGSSLALFSTNCAAWHGTIDMHGCMYNKAVSAADNKIKWYTIRIQRSGTAGWEFVSQNYKHPKYSKRLLPNYTGDDVGPFSVALKIDGGAAVNVPAYINIQREVNVDGVDWLNDKIDRFMQLSTGIYDLISGVHTPGTFYVKVNGYDSAGNSIATDMIPLYIHNVPLNYEMTGLTLADPSIINAGCGLYRLTNAQLNTEMRFQFRANDPYGFVDSFALTMGRCPAPMLALQASPMADTLSGASVLSQGASSSVQPACLGYTGTTQVFSDAGLINVALQPAVSEGGWIKTGEYYTVHSFHLSAVKRVTNGYNTGHEVYNYLSNSIAMERLSGA
jgi:hypothetical protein